MRCPSCRAPAIENDAACGQCGFSLELADRTFGIAPVLERPISDPTGLMGTFAHRKSARVIDQFERHFPQVSLAAVLLAVPDQVPLATYAFWIFNRSQLSSALEKGGDNRLVMLLIDTQSDHAIAMVGYGLEPFIQETHLQCCLQAALQPLQRGQHGQAIEGFTRELNRQFQDLCSLVPKQFGLVENKRWLDFSTAGEDLFGTADSVH